MKILITGATGLVGKKLCLALARSGHQLLILTRHPESSHLKIPAPHHSFNWDVEPGHNDTEAFKSLDAVIHLAGENVASGRWNQKRVNSIIQSRVGGMQKLWNIIEKFKVQPSVIISASATGFYGDRKDELLTETAKPGQGFLSETCQKWENALFHPTQKQFKNIRKVTLRIGMILDEQEGALEKILPIFENNLGGKLGNGKQWMPWIHIDDLVKLFEFSLFNKQVEGPLNASAPEMVNNLEFTKTLSKSIHKLAILPAPAFAIKSIMGRMSEIILASQKISSQKALDLRFIYQYPHLEDALSDLTKARLKGFQLFKTSQWINQPIETTFEFFSKTENLELITPQHLNFKVSHQSSSSIEEGTHIQYRLKLHGIPFKWTSLIKSWEPNHSFIDIQIKGPYHTWHHTHRFESLDGGTLIHDEVQYRCPFSFLGRIMNLLWIRKEIESIFSYRKNVVAHAIGRS